ncbi:hypothetical protein [Neobacillus cucumis]|uniref:hypothetical protein n=1 Tax=Neobacillus cucumis TaxID=1740721 RepID=UPI0028535AAA|nr:hypothetical protein [Neobacillus cucumis]MDR4949782.1 hypothetical protein [Neobacillus cucumis]
MLERMLGCCQKGIQRTSPMDDSQLWRNLSGSSARLLVPVLLLTYYILNGFSLPAGREKMVEVVLNVNIWVGLILNIMMIEWKILQSGKLK